MAAGKMHAHEVDIDIDLVGRLLASQFPLWAGLPLEPFQSIGTSNAIFRLGATMSVRLPRIQGATGEMEKEFKWLPRLAPLLPLAIPNPIAIGTPGEGYPWRWSIYDWLDGESATPERITDGRQSAVDLGRFVAAMQRIDPAGGPTFGQHNWYKGAPLVAFDAAVRAAIAALGDTLDTRAATAAWEAALRTPTWDGPPVWFHGDLIAGNLLAAQGQLSAVIDFGCLAIGDPACDLMTAWAYLSEDTREVFRGEVHVDDATWDRGRGYALTFGLIALPYYETTNPGFVEIARNAVDAVLADQRPAS
jgi:aminoglycoside phosphotransferase (APT) family kinase protein